MSKTVHWVKRVLVSTIFLALGAIQAVSASSVAEVRTWPELADALTANERSHTGGLVVVLAGDIERLEEDVPLPDITKDLTVRGDGHTVDGKGISPEKDAIFRIKDGNAVFENFKVTGGSGFWGGAFYVMGGTVGLAGMTLSDNVADTGGALMLKNGNVSLLNTEISRNRSDVAGGGISVYGGKISIIDTVIFDNVVRVGGGGGIQSLGGGDIELFGVQVVGNTANWEGGGLSFYSRYGGKITITDCEISQNRSSEYGGGIFVHDKNRSLRLENTKIHGNTAGEGGGGLCAESTSVSAFNSTIVGNRIAEELSAPVPSDYRIVDPVSFESESCVVGVRDGGDTDWPDGKDNVKNADPEKLLVK